MNLGVGFWAGANPDFGGFAIFGAFGHDIIDQSLSIFDIVAPQTQLQRNGLLMFLHHGIAGMVVKASQQATDTIRLPNLTMDLIVRKV
mmetsp:Transcript_35055/g.43281  ORF Transcript_35055/g.43281 Transcript_35055/m.43281 type:complete len:88 (-) Transcript_35055:493-756(-)